ncbi:hypothetical protein Tco_0065294 [Tanacetum coccineum]
MSTLPFADTHNLVAFLSKPAKSEGFEQIVKTVNGEVQLQALVDGKKIIINAATIRRDLQLEDAEEAYILYGFLFSPMDVHIILFCNALCAKTTAWNEFSSTMASAIICLATNQKFNFSKYIFDSMVKNVDNVNNFLMYSRFVHVFVNQQAGDMSNHKRIYVTPSHTKKVFRNMKREGKGFSRRVTPVFPTMMVQALEEMGEADEAFTEENVSKHSNDPLLSGEDSMKLEELMKLCTNLQQRVIDLETTNTTQGSEITSLKRREDASKQRRKIDDIDADAGITLVDETHRRHDDDLMFNTGVLNDDEVLTG